MGNEDNQTPNSNTAFYIAIFGVMIYILGSFIPAISHPLIGKANMLYGLKDNDITSILVLAFIIANVAAIVIRNKTAIILSGFGSCGVIIYAIMNIVQANEQINASPFAAFAGGGVELLPGIFIALAASIIIIISALNINSSKEQSSSYKADGDWASGKH